jgi:hypothetical protein
MGMTTENRQFAEPPLDLRDTLPSVEQVQQCLEGDLSAGEGLVLYRAASREEYILTLGAARAHRFGPPEAVRALHGGPPYGLLYVADSVETAMWEAQFCRHDVTRPGTYYLAPAAVEHGVVAELQFARAPRLWNLNGSASSRLGIFDQITSPDYAWCQWFGYLLYQARQAASPDTRPDGFIYPSRRHRGHAAVALFTPAEALYAGISYTAQPFTDTAAYASTLTDPLRVEPPATGA